MRMREAVGVRKALSRVARDDHGLVLAVLLLVGGCSGGAATSSGTGGTHGAGGATDGGGTSGAGGSSAAGGSGAGASGLDRSRKLVDLTPAEWTQLCNAAPRPVGPDGGIVMCPTGSALTINDPSLCIREQSDLRADCTATVGTSEDCTRTLADNPCDPTTSLSTPACLATQVCLSPYCPQYCDANCVNADAATKVLCSSSCLQYTQGLTYACASCVLSGHVSNTCGEFTPSSPPAFDQCRPSCPGVD